MIREEMKKIWRPGMLLALAILGLVFYTMFLEFYIRHFPNGPYNTAVIEISAQLVQKYGTSISEAEMEEFEQGLPKLRRQADQYVRESEPGKKYGLHTYKQYDAFCRKAAEEASQKGETADQNEHYADAMRMHNYLQGDETDNIEGRLYAASWFVEIYRARQKQGPALDNCSNQKERDHASFFYGTDKRWQNLLPKEVPETTSDYMGYLLIWICLSVCILLSPPPVCDRMNRMRALQYSSRRGRNIYHSQFAAVMLSAFLVTTANATIFLGLFLKNGTAVFFPCKMYSFAVMQLSWPNWTYGVWCLILLIISYLVAFGTAGIVFFLSHKSGNYIIMMLRVVPLGIFLAVFCPKLMGNAFYFNNPLYRFSGIAYAELLAAGVMFLVGMCCSNYFS